MKRRRLTAAERAEVWVRRQRGEPQRVIARALEVTAPTIHKVLLRTGGIAPRPRRRGARVLQLAEREEISRGVAAGQSFRALARQIGRAPSTVSREVGRHGGRIRYRAGLADGAAWARARRPKLCRLARARKLRRLVAGKLARHWSPEQIAEWLKRTYPETTSLHVSHETIYRTLFVQSRGVFKRAVLQHLRRRPPRAGRPGR
jgi:IS30 family transposase